MEFLSYFDTEISQVAASTSEARQDSYNNFRDIRRQGISSHDIDHFLICPI